MPENKIVLRHEDRSMDEDGQVDTNSGGITPGELVEFYGNGDYDVHATAGGTRPEPRFAKKAGAIGDEISDAIAADEHIKVALCQTGVRVYARLADGENVSEGELLSSNGDGTLRSAEDGTSPDGEDAAVARAAEAVDNTDADGDPDRIIVEVL